MTRPWHSGPSTEPALRAATLAGKIVTFPNNASRMRVLTALWGPGATEGCLDADELHEILWEPYCRLHADEPCEGLYLS